MQLITNTGMIIDLNYVRVIDVKEGEKLVYKAPMPAVRSPEEFQEYMQNVMNGLSQVFGKDVPILLIGPGEDFLVIKENEITKIISMSKPIKEEQEQKVDDAATSATPPTGILDQNGNKI